MKKGFKILGMVVSVALVIFGVLIMCGVFDRSVSYPDSANVGYDSGYAIFGADFYNYVCNNSAEAADAAQAAANNTIDIIHIITSGFGAVIIAMGLLGFCFFGMMPVGAFKVQNVALRNPAPVRGPVPAPMQHPVQMPAPMQTPVASVQINDPAPEAPAPMEAPVCDAIAVSDDVAPVNEAVQEPTDMQ